MKYYFPVNKKNIGNYPNLKNTFHKDLSKDFSQKQIFRLLDNIHYDGIKKLVEFIEKFLSDDKYYEFLIQKIKTKDYSQFSTNIKEIFLLNFLLKKGFNIYTFDDNKTDKPVPEFLISNSTTEMLVEFYSPIELYGFEKFFIELVTALNYFPNDIGFHCVINVKSDSKQPIWIKNQIIPFELNYKYSNDKVRYKEIDNILSNFFQIPHSNEIEKLFYLTDDIYITTSTIIKSNSNNRLITYTYPSYDSVKDYVLIQKNSKGFYKKLLRKINFGQLNKTEHSTAIRVLFVDFSHSMGSEVLIKGIGKDFLSNTFYKNLSQRLQEDVSENKLDLLIPVISGIDDKFILGNCLFNPKNINTNQLFNTN